MEKPNWTGLSDEAIAAELEWKQAPVKQAKRGSRWAAWQATAICALTMIAMLVFAWISRGTSVMPWLPLLMPFFIGLPAVFFRLAREQREMENEISELRGRVEGLEKAAAEHRSAAG